MANRRTQRPHRHRDAAAIPDWALPVAIALAGLAARLAWLGERSFWFDEAVTVLAATRPMAGGPAPLPEPPLWVFGIRLWTTLPVALSETFIRLPAALAGAAIPPLTWLVARRWLPPGGALAAMALAAISPVEIVFSQEARMYGLLAALGVAAVALLPERPLWYGVVVAVGGALHPVFLLGLPAHTLLILATAPRSRWASCIGSAVAGALPGIGFVLLRRDAMAHVAAHPIEPLQPLLEFGLRALAMAGGGPLLDPGWRVAGLILFSAAFVLGSTAGTTSRRIALAGLALLPPLLLHSLSGAGWIAAPPLRYAAVAHPFFLIACAAGCWRLPVRARGVGLAALLTVNAVALGAYYRGADPMDGLMPSKKPFRTVAGFIRSRLRPGDTIVHLSPSSAVPFRIYLPDAGSHPYLIADPSIPPAMERWLGAAVRPAAAVASARRAWLVVAPVLFTDPPEIPGFLRASIERTLGTPVRHEFPGVHVYLATIR